ncbi:MAG TPA: hypothetical protein VKB79_18960 [Bryobacteraceae bacterium]|nr:hypothetical protein [Bryobacteraceae bacterium]
MRTNYTLGFYLGDNERDGNELLRPVDAAAISIAGAADVTPAEPHPTLHLKLSLDPCGLTLRQQDNGLAFKFTRMFAELDASGKTLVEGQDSKELVVPAESLDAVYRERIHWEQELPLMPGAATVRVIVHDETTGQAGTLTVLFLMRINSLAGFPRAVAGCCRNSRDHGASK